MRVAVVQFPGSNADWDALQALQDGLGADAFPVFHRETELGAGLDAVVLPGGFAHGDYLRPGAIAALSPIAPAIRRFAEGGGPVLGICNGFQVLTELRLLPGALTRNDTLRFQCRDVHVRVEGSTPLLAHLSAGTVLRLPIAHADGRYQCPPDVLRELEAEGRVVLRYCTQDGERHPGANPNGSVSDVAGIVGGPKRNVLGLMPHPERAADGLLGNDAGLAVLRGLEGPDRTGGASGAAA